ncbi:TPA: hypothetical protein UDO34_000110, partial [Streptococcus suis]|nr:hypothetical protein [Streptococcus suis]
MYFNRKNSQQKNWRMIKKGKHFLFGCALVFAIGASANVASAETIVSEATADQTQQVTETSESAGSENVTSTTAVSEEATSTTATSETVASSETAESETSTVASSEVATSETSTAASSEVASSETSTSATEVVASETSSTTSATSVANRTAYIGYEVQYTTSTGEVVGKTANIVAADTTEAVATATLTVSATDVPAGYELAAEQAFSLTQQISENQINILSFAVVKKSEEEEIAASQLENKTPLLQAVAEAEALTSEATRLLATSQQGNQSLAAATEATKVVTTEATTVLKDPTATVEQVQATTATVQESSVSLGEELAKLNAEGIVTAQLSSVTGSAAVTDLYNITWDNQSVPGRTDAGFELMTDANGKRILVYKYNLADTTAFTMDDVLKQLNAIPKDANAGLRTLDGTEKSKLESATDGYGTAGRSAQLNGQTIDFLDIVNPVKLWGGQRVVGAASPAGMDPNYTTLYVPGTTDKGTKSHQTTVGGTNGTSTVTLDGTNTFDFYSNQVDRQKLYIRSVEAAYEGGTGSAVDTDTDTDFIPVYMVGYEDTTRPTVTANTTTGTQLNASSPVSEYLFVFGTTEGTTSISTVIDPNTKKAPTGTPVVNKNNATATFATMTDPENDALTISYDDNAASPKTMTSLGSNLTLGTDGKLEGSFAHAAGGSYTRRVVVTDPSGDKGTSNAFYTYSYTDKEVDTTPVLKRDGVAVTEAEVFAKLAIANTSTTFPVNGTGQTAPTIPDSEYTRTIVGYLPLGSETVTEATASTLPTSGQYEVVVRTRNIYGQDIYNWVTVQYQPATLYVFNNTAIKTVDPATKQPNGVDKVSIATLTDPEGIKSVAITREGATLGYTVDTDGNASGTPSVGAIGYYSSSLTITDNQDNTTEVFRNDGVDNRYVTHIMDATVTGEVTKGVGETPTEAEILAQVNVNTGNSGNIVADPTSMYEKVLAPGQTLPTTPGRHEVTVRVITDSNVYKDVTVVVNIPANTPTTGTDKQTIYVFNNTPIQTVDPATKEPNNVNEVKVVTLTDPEGIKSVTVTREGESLDYSVDTDGNAFGTPSVGALGYYSSSLTVTDNLDSTTEVFANGTSDERFMTHIMDATVTGEVTKAVGETPTEAEILAKVNVDTGNSGNIVADPTSMYEKILAPGQTVPTTPGTHNVTVRVITDSNVYKDVVVVVNIPANTPTTATDKQTIYVFNNTPIQTVDPTTKEPNNVNEVKVATLTDPEGIKSVAIDNLKDLGYTVDTDGNASGTPSVTDIGYYSSALNVTDNANVTTQVFPKSPTDQRYVTHIMDVTVTGEVNKAAGQTPTEAEILEKVAVNTGNSGNIVADPTSMYEKILAPGQTLPTTEGTYTVTVRVITDSNVYKDVPVTVIIPDSTAPVAPEVDAKEDGSVTVTPAGDDTTTVDITYTDENGVETTVTATKADNGEWSVPENSVVTVNPTTGVVTIPADKVKDNSTVSATSTDEVGNTSTPAEATTPATTDNVTPVPPAVTEVTDPSNLTDAEKAKVQEAVKTANPGLPTGTTVAVGNDGTVTITYPDGSVDTIPATNTVVKDSTAPEAPVVTANPDGSVTVTPAGDDTTTVEIKYTDENGVEKTVTATKGEDGTWSVPADSGVTVDPTTGVVT